MPVEWIEHKGKRILVNDCRGLAPDAIVENLDLVAKMTQDVPPPAKIRYLTRSEGASINTEVMVRVKELGRTVFEPRTEKRAITGVKGIRNVLLSAYNRVTGAGANQKLFDTVEEALDWLVS